MRTRPSIYTEIKEILVDQRGCQDASLTCPSYLVQKRGTCCYSVIDAWLQSRLSPADMHQYRYQSAEYVVRRLSDLLTT